MDLLRQKSNTIIKWRGDFKIHGKCTLSWANGDQLVQDISIVLDKDDLVFYTFGSWKYADTDILKVSLSGAEQRELCEHKAGERRECNMSD